eukprot:scaffold3118_cov64-Phaeocystis_antarctica.AAC.5
MWMHPPLPDALLSAMRESTIVTVAPSTPSPPPLPLPPSSYVIAWQRRIAMRVNVCTPPERSRIFRELEQSEKVLSIQVLKPPK